MHHRRRVHSPALFLGALSLLLLGGCVVALGDGESGSKAYTTGEYVQHVNKVSEKKRALAHRVVNAIENDPLLRKADITARVTGHVVTLTGTLYSVATLRHAIQVLRGVRGVATVVSQVELKITE